MQQVIGFIPARGGSKGIKDKNIVQIAGKPLIYWACRALENSKHIKKFVIATDSKKIKDVVLSFGFHKLEVYDRQVENAQDTSATIDVVLEYFNAVYMENSEMFCLIQATSPNITASDIDLCIEQMKDGGFDSAFGCVELRRVCWRKDATPINHDLKERKRRHELEAILVENGAIYLNTVGNIKNESQLLTGKIFPFIMQEDTMTEIDEPEDLIKVEEILKQRLNREKN